MDNENFKDYFFHQVIQKVLLEIDETGVKVKNSAKITVLKCRKVCPPQKKYIILDKPFWVIMREKDANYPYFIAYINCLKEKV